MTRPAPLPLPAGPIALSPVLLETLAERAAHADREGTGLSEDMRLLEAAGLTTACLPPEAGGRGLGLGGAADSARDALAVLRALGRASLPVARLYEGHLNAIKLIHLYGAAPLRARLFEAVRKGAILGVWGADGIPPLRFSPDGQVLKLSGEKRFASGLGTLSWAVVSLRPADDAPQRLAVVEVTEAARARPEAWDASGMRATLSGSFDFSGMPLDPALLLGEPGDYEREPHFEGGVWRYAAAQLGGAEAILSAWRASLLSRRRTEDPFQLSRFARAAGLCRAAAALLKECCVAVETAPREEADRVVAETLLARQFVEEVCIEVMALAEKSLGVEAHLEKSPVERLRRDLSLYIRQAAPDAKLTKAARTLLRPDAAEDAPW